MTAILRNDSEVKKILKDYREAFATARRRAMFLDAKTRAKLAQVYRVAGDEAAKVAADALERGLSKLTEERWAVIAAKLQDSADRIAEETESGIKDLVKLTAPLFPEVDADLVLDAAKLAKVDRKITREGLGRIVSGVQEDVMKSLVSRIYSDGYSFSDRIWKTGTDDSGRPASVRADWQERIKMTVAAGIAQGRDPAKIAKDIQVYTKDGRIALAKRWGPLERGTAEYAKRLPGKIDWRAQRLVRSELYASLQDAQVSSGRKNPASDGLYDWVLSNGRQHWECECEALAAGSPYKADEVPSYPHPNCLCYIRPHLINMDKFVADLAAWAKGGSVEYLDKWHRDVYAAAA